MDYGSDIINSMVTWYMFYSQRMLEKKDRQQIQKTMNKATKLVFLSFLAGAFANRFLTYLKIGNFEFINLRLIFRLPIRFAVFGLLFNVCALGPVLRDVENLYYNLHDKYYPRYEVLRNSCEPLAMNPKMLNEEGMSEDEKDEMVILYQKTKDGLMMAKQMRLGGPMF
jgi:hypothetical protein